MNNIYKVIWSKAKNCYVVASEIARSHTKSASGSEKIGGGTRRKLLASLMALSLLCGGLGVASAVDVVKVDVSTTSTTEVYTTTGVDEKIEALRTGDVATNRDNIVKLQTTTAGQADAIKDLKDRTTNISYDSGKRSTSINGIDIGDTQVDMNGKKLTGVGTINGIDIGDTQVDMNGKKLTDVGTINGIDLGTVDTQVKTNADAIAQEKTDREKAIGSLTENKNYIKKDKNVSDNLVELDKQAKTNADAIAQEKTDRENAIGSLTEDKNYIKKDKNVSDNLVELDKQAKTNADAIAQEKTDRENAIGSLTEDKNYIKKDKNVSDNLVELDKQAKANADAITETNQRTAGINRDDTKKETSIEGKVTVDTNGNIKAEGTITSNGLDARAGEIKTTGKVSAGDVSTGTLETMGNAKIGGDLTVNGKLNVGEIYMEHKKQESTGEEYDSATSITADGISNNAKVTDRNGVKTESKFTHDKEGSTTYAYQGDAANWKKSTSNVTADGVENVAEDSKGNNNTFTQTSTDTKNTLTDKAGNTSSTRQDSKGIYGYAKDKDGNKSYTKQEGNRIAESVIGQDGKETKSEMTSTNITNTAKDGTITSDAKDIVNKATGNISNSSATMDTTVTGKATESYGELETEVKGNEKHTVKGDQTNEVDGKQINTIKNGQENIISGGQTNTITGGQINNITGDQTTTITGNKTETVTENVTEDYKKNLTTTVGGNEIHEVKGTKTETVKGKLTENFKGGQETNVTGDQTTNVSGTQTTTATDINRNASSGMIDTIDNDYGTNTETKVAGKTTTDVSIKGTGEEGKYIRGANESRDYLIKGTLKNSETKTVEKTSTEITDGNGKTSATIQDKTQISGSVTNGTSSAVSNVKADSIDTAVIEGTNTSLISQKKDSITSAVGNGTTSTVIQQGDKDITIASNGGTVGIVGKDIINNATNEITNTAGTKITDKVGNNTRVIDQTSITDTVGTASRKIEDGKITDTAGDSTVTTENGKGTTFTKTDSTAFSTAAGAPTDTNIAGNHITTGRVDANELGVSDKDDQGNTADLSVKAGEGIKGSATDKDGNKTYTKVTATENSFQVQDKDGNIKNHQVNTKDSSENTITNGDKTNTVTSTADGTTFNNSKANTAFEGGTYKNTTIKGNTITTGKVTMDYADVMKDLGVRGNATINGKTTTGSLEVTGISTLKGDVTMENNATVGNNLTVNGTTKTKTLNVTENAEVGGELKVAKKATFEDSVSIAKDLTVGGDVTAKSYKVGDKTYISADGINANDQKITNVADGSISEGSKDAVNGGQLYGMKTDLEHKVDKVGANAAAMANLHPMEFDPDSKWNIAAAMGNYGSETATAIGAFYRPNEDVMVNFSTAFGTGENMVGGGVSVRLGKGGNKLSREESNALKAQVNDLTARMDALLSVLNPNMSKDFPDVPENHWAYEAVSRLAGNDIVQGYPDGEFHGDRTMTRYEMAEIIYNALSRGAEAEKELVEEFKPELQAMAASEKATAERAEG